MPHSVTPPAEGESPTTAENVVEETPVEETTGAVEGEKPEAQEASAQEDEDAPMQDAPETEAAPTEPKPSEVKLEDLFAGMDSDDDEFPSSAPGVKKEISSSPEMPSSPG